LNAASDVRAPGETRFVGDDRERAQPLQCQRRAVEQGVPRGNDHAVRPAIAGQGDQARVLRERFGGDADIGLARQQHLGDLARRALVHVERHLAEARAKIAHRRR
jgi:hypothetical protein